MCLSTLNIHCLYDPADIRVYVGRRETSIEALIDEYKKTYSRAGGLNVVNCEGSYLN